MFGRILKIVALVIFIGLIGIKILSFVGIDLLAMLSLSRVITPNRFLFLMIFDALLLTIAFFIEFRKS